LILLIKIKDLFTLTIFDVVEFIETLACSSSEKMTIEINDIVNKRVWTKENFYQLIDLPDTELLNYIEFFILTKYPKSKKISDKLYITKKGVIKIEDKGVVEKKIKGLNKKEKVLILREINFILINNVTDFEFFKWLKRNKKELSLSLDIKIDKTKVTVTNQVVIKEYTFIDNVIADVNISVNVPELDVFNGLWETRNFKKLKAYILDVKPKNYTSIIQESRGYCNDKINLVITKTKETELEVVENAYEYEVDGLSNFDLNLANKAVKVEDGYIEYHINFD